MGDVTVREARLDDDSALLELDRAGWTTGSGFPSFQTKLGDTFFTERRQPEGILVATVDDRVAGYVMVRPRHPVAEAAHVLGLWGLVVDPGVRRRGVASALLTAAEQAARAQGARKLSLQVLGSNNAALELYQSCGYVIEGRRRDEFLIDGAFVDHLDLSKFL